MSLVTLGFSRRERDRDVTGYRSTVLPLISFFLYQEVWIPQEAREVPGPTLFPRPAPQAFSKQVRSPAKRLCEISCHTCVKTRVQGIIEGNRAIYKLLTDCFNGYDSCKV